MSSGIDAASMEGHQKMSHWFTIDLLKSQSPLLGVRKETAK